MGVPQSISDITPRIIELTRKEWLESRMESLTLAEQEIIEATGYTRAAEQLAALPRAGIPADRRADGSVRVWRHHIIGIGAPAQQRTPRRQPKSASDRKAA